MTAARVWAFVPVKPFKFAKTRLAPVLTATERARLARVMLEDVLTTLALSRHVLAGVMVVTADDDAVALARDHGADVLTEPAPSGLNAALARAMTGMTDTCHAGLLIVPADLPQMAVRDIVQIVDLLEAPRSAVLVPAAADGGTNLLGCRPPGAIAPQFGPFSFERHHRAALQAGIVPRVLTGTAATCDIDRPDDLDAFLALRTVTRTHTYLSSLGLAMRTSLPHAEPAIGNFEPVPSADCEDRHERRAAR